MKNWTLALSLVTLLGCVNNDKDDLTELVKSMTGSFDSSKQASQDSSYFDISLHMYPIWENREGHWIYVEQALSSMQDKPYRQRIYLVEKIAEGSFSSKVYAIEQDSLFTGKWQTPAFFNDFDESVLLERMGCAVYLDLVNGVYSGSTKDRECESKLRGATYATSRVSIYPDRIESWDQGFDANNVQVWGAEKGGYIFDRL